jgi:hypothetical protein
MTSYRGVARLAEAPAMRLVPLVAAWALPLTGKSCICQQASGGFGGGYSDMMPFASGPHPHRAGPLMWDNSRQSGVCRLRLPF